MNLLLQLLVAAVLVAIMIVVRMYSDDRVLKHRLSCGNTRRADCSGGCHKHDDATGAGSG